jgi:hypothetical protein
MTSNDAGGSASYGDYSVDDSNQLQPGDLLDDDDVADVLDRGYSPAERWSPGQGYGNTPREEAVGESLEQRLRQEETEPDPYAEPSDDEQDEADPDPETGNRRAGRLVDPDQGQGEDMEKDMIGDDVGIDGAGASAEEAAMHVIDDDEDEA